MLSGVKLIKVVLVNMLGRERISAVSRVEFFDRVCNSDGTLVRNLVSPELTLRWYNNVDI
jgi:hypothetical protein